MGAGFEFDTQSLKKYIDGPLAEATTRLQNAAQSLSGGQAGQEAYPAVARGTAGHQSAATEQVRQTLTEATTAIEAIAQRLQHTIEVYSGAEQANITTSQSIDI